MFLPDRWVYCFSLVFLSLPFSSLHFCFTVEGVRYFCFSVSIQRFPTALKQITWGRWCTKVSWIIFRAGFRVQGVPSDPWLPRCRARCPAILMGKWMINHGDLSTRYGHCGEIWIFWSIGSWKGNPIDWTLIFQTRFPKNKWVMFQFWSNPASAFRGDVPIERILCKRNRGRGLHCDFATPAAHVLKRSKMNNRPRSGVVLKVHTRPSDPISTYRGTCRDIVCRISLQLLEMRW